MRHGHGGVVLGSEMSGGIINIRVRDCNFEGTDKGIHIKTRRRRGGYVDDVNIEGIRMIDVPVPIVFNMFYRCASDWNDETLHGLDPQPLSESTPRLGRFKIRGIHATGALIAAMYMIGLPEHPIEQVILEDVHIETSQDPDAPAMQVYAPAVRGVGPMINNVADLQQSNITCRTYDPPSE